MKSLLTGLYGFLTGLERNFFAALPFLSYRPAARVISIGNLSMGGTGKTPVLFELLAELNNADVCVLSRGYRSPWERSFYLLLGNGPHPSELTDEALLLNSRFPQVPLLLGKNRHHSAIVAEKRFKPGIILLDDGFQYRRLRKDINLVLWDAMADVEEARLIPAGRLREPVWRLNQASAILLTRCESCSETRILDWQHWLNQRAPGVPVIRVKTICDGIYDHTGQRLTAQPSAKRYFVFSAIGRPASFYRQLECVGCNIGGKAEFRDHHRFSAEELADLGRKATAKNLQLICTEKDFCKIPSAVAARLNIHTLRIRTVPASGLTFIDELQRNGIAIAPKQ